MNRSLVALTAMVAILQRFDTDGAGPNDVALAPDGSIWSSGFVNGDVGHIVDGTYSVPDGTERLITIGG